MAEAYIMDEEQALFQADNEPPAGDAQPSLVQTLQKLQQYASANNVADLLEDAKLVEIGQTVCDEFKIDERSRESWERTAKQAMKAALQEADEKNYPFHKASNVKYPLITVAATQFNARAYPAIINDGNIVKAKVLGDDEGVPAVDETGQPLMEPVAGPDGQPVMQQVWQIPPGFKREKGDRVAAHMSYQLTEQMEEWEEDTDTLLMQIPIIGCAFRKVWHDPKMGRCRSEMVSAFDLVVNQSVKSLNTAPRVTHRDCTSFYPSVIEENFRSGEWRRVDIGEPQTGDGDKDAPHEFLEQHRRLDLDDDGYAEPYIVTVHRESTQVVRIVANFDDNDIVFDTGAQTIVRIPPRDFFVKYPFLPDPEGGFYDIGFGRLLDSLSGTIDTAINQMIDAGHLQTAGGGFIASGVRFRKNRIRVSPGEYQVVEAAGGDLRNGIYNHQHPGPSPVLFQLLGLLIEAAKDITAVKDIMTGETGERNQTATTTLALIEQGMKVFTAIYKRIYRSLKKEFKLLFELNAQYLEQDEYFNWADNPAAVSTQDYDPSTFDIAPAADPKVVTDMLRLARAQILLQFNGDPYVDQLEMRRRYFEATGIEDIDGILTEPQPDPAAMAEMDAKVKKILSEAMRNQAAAQKDQAEILEMDDRVRMDAQESSADIEKTAAEVMQILAEVMRPQVPGLQEIQ